MAFLEYPTIIDNEDYPFDTFWFWLSESKQVGCYVHFHKEMELIYVATGSIDIWLDGKKFTVGPEHLILIQSNETHHIKLAEGTCVYFGVKFDPSILHSTKQTVSELKTLIPFNISSSVEQRIFKRNDLSCDVRSILESAVNEGQKREFGFTLAIRSRIIEIVLAIIREWHRQGIIKDDEIPTGLAETIQQAQNYIKQNFVDVNEVEIAKKCNMSYSYFSRSFKKFMGVSFSEYVNHTRINEAQKLLISSDKSVSEIAQALGFSSASHFIRTFKNCKGCTPNQFKKVYYKST